jgi:pyruvate/2-oxoacid:ferredoxin oxidoreductase alpha subunit
MYPFFADEFKKRIKGKTFTIIENNITALLKELVNKSCETDIKGSVLKYDGRSFTAEGDKGNIKTSPSISSGQTSQPGFSRLRLE